MLSTRIFGIYIWGGTIKSIKPPPQTFLSTTFHHLPPPVTVVVHHRLPSPSTIVATGHLRESTSTGYLNSEWRYVNIYGIYKKLTFKIRLKLLYIFKKTFVFTFWFFLKKLSSRCIPLNFHISSIYWYYIKKILRYQIHNLNVLINVFCFL